MRAGLEERIQTRDELLDLGPPARDAERGRLVHGQ